MTFERLGSATVPYGHSGQLLDAEVWVCWLSAPLAESLTALAMLGDLHCPGCDDVWPLGRPGGVLVRVFDTPNCASVSDSCMRCGAVLHLDTTADADRAGLHWLAVAGQGAPLRIPDGMSPERAEQLASGFSNLTVSGRRIPPTEEDA